MDGVDNARFDLFEAIQSLETAIELLGGLERDGAPEGEALRAIVNQLKALKEGAEDAEQRLTQLRPCPSGGRRPPLAPH